MSQGSAQTRLITKTILKHIKHEDEFYPRIGRDYSVVSKIPGESAENSRHILECSNKSYLISAVGLAVSGGIDVPKSMTVGAMALIRAINNLSMGGAQCESISVCIHADCDCAEESLRCEMIALTNISKKLGIRIIGGNTYFLERQLLHPDMGGGYDIEITAFGNVDEACIKQLSEKPKKGDKVVILGDAGEYGAAMITDKKREEMTSRFSDSYMEQIVAGYNRDKDIMNTICIAELAKELVQAGAIYIHDVTFGGIYRTLLETSEYSGLGIQVRHEDIPIKQSTIEVCEFWNLNPYKLLGIGGIVAVFRGEEGEIIEKINNLKLTESGKSDISIRVAGELTGSKERLILSERNKTHRSITLYEEDEIYKIKTALALEN